jgi:hypothetical protein
MIAVLHILGALVSLLAISTPLFFLGFWIDQRNAERGLQDATVDLGRPLSEFDSPEFAPELLRYLGAKYSDDLIKNRLSDFLGSVLTAFNWLLVLIQLVVVGSVAWYSFTENQTYAVYAWFVLLIPVFGLIISLCVSVLCKLVTGRFPGQAKQARKILAERINQES